MTVSSLVVLVTDRIYAKTRRHLQKVKLCVGEQCTLYLACVSGFPKGLEINLVRDLVSGVIEGSVHDLATSITSNIGCVTPPIILALNQSAILPALALQRLLSLPLRSGFIEACDKGRMRELLFQSGGSLAMEYRVASPGKSGSSGSRFKADRYIVKPRFGMSSSDVKIFDSWGDAKGYAESPAHRKEWVPQHVINALRSHIKRTDQRIIEPRIEGTEFSIDGWIAEGSFHAQVQHKLFMVQSSFIGDGPTVSPPSTKALAGFRE
jgi:hypothetical protein